MAVASAIIAGLTTVATTVSEVVQGQQRKKLARRQADKEETEALRRTSEIRRARTAQMGALAGGGSLAGSAKGTLLGS